jgi:TRAP-type C4-dicarboxylate transport system substrate-binding protein
MSKQGVTFTYPDAAVMQQFRNATQSVYAEFEGTRVMEYVERIRAVQ